MAEWLNFPQAAFANICNRELDKNPQMSTTTRFTSRVAKCLVRNAEAAPSIDLGFTLGIESTKFNARQREVVLCPSPSAQDSALMRSPRPSAPAVWVRFTVRAI